MWIARGESRRKYWSPMDSSVTRPTFAIFRRAGVRETTVLLALAWAVPFLVHLLPWSGPRPLGVYLLPMFWTTFVAVYLYGAPLGLAVGLFAPAINLVLTGLPANKYVLEAMLELTVFALATTWAVRRWPHFLVIAPLGYVVARLAWAEWLARTDPAVQVADVRTAATTIGRSLVNGAAGLLVLAGINVALVWFYPKPKAGAGAVVEA
jgi:hypothetical protein